MTYAVLALLAALCAYTAYRRFALTNYRFSRPQDQTRFMAVARKLNGSKRTRLCYSFEMSFLMTSIVASFDVALFFLRRQITGSLAIANGYIALKILFFIFFILVFFVLFYMKVVPMHQRVYVALNEEEKMNKKLEK